MEAAEQPAYHPDCEISFNKVAKSSSSLFLSKHVIGVIGGMVHGVQHSCVVLDFMGFCLTFSIETQTIWCRRFEYEKVLQDLVFSVI